MFEEVKKLLVENMQIDADEIKMESELANDLRINSLELADLVLLCEDKFSIEIKDEDLPKFITVGDVVDYISKNVK